jgi:phytoene dehydrogenase-like protein
VIVGGGHNGLTAAAYLARAGRSCLLLERRERLGGAAISESLFAGVPARLSSYAYLVSLLPETIVRELALPLRLARRTVSSYTPDPRARGRRGLLVDASDAAATRASFAAVTGGAAELAAWERFYAATGRLARRVFGTLTEPLRSREQLRGLVDDAEAWELVFERPLGETVAARFADDLVAGVVLTDATIGTFTAADDAQMLANRCFLYHVIGRGTGEWRVPVGGMGAVSEALESAARTAGAELHTSAEVLAIGLARDGAEVGFTSGGREASVRARRVLVNAAPHELSRLLGRPAAAPAPEGSQLKVNLLLSRLPRLREPAIEARRAFAGTFHVNETASQLRRAHEQASAGQMPDLPPCEAYCHSLADPGVLGAKLRATGVQTLTVFVLQMPARLFAKDPAGAREEATRRTLRSLESVLAEPIEDCLLHDGEGRPCIHVHSPLDLERDLRMPGGHIFHRDLSWPFAEREEEIGGWGVETEDPAILLCGAGARRGGGVSGIPGRNAAMAVLEA